MTDIFFQRHSRTIQLISEEAFKRLQNTHVLIAGLGGVGGYAAEQLVRAGVGLFTLVDNDAVSPSNINRQLIADCQTTGTLKTELFAERMKTIAPEVKIIKKQVYICENEVSNLFADIQPDYVVDAIDTLMPKVNLINYCLDHKIPVVSSLGAGGKLKPEMVRVADISKTYNDGLGRMLRKRLHKRGIYKGFKAVFSPEDVAPETRKSEESKNKKTNLGTISYMPAFFGLYCASVVLRDLIGLKL